MSAAILNFVRRGRTRRDWSDQELAEFLRVADALTQAGRRVETDRGLTDEGDPWFIFVRPETDEVIAHFARIDGEVLADASALAEPVRGENLRDVLDKVAAHYTLVLPNASRNNKLFVHPAAILAALVATALLEVQEASAERAGPGRDADLNLGAKGEGGRNATAGLNQPTPVTNPGGRAVSFNESGLVGDSPLNTGVLFSTIAAVLSLSAHATNAETTTQNIQAFAAGMVTQGEPVEAVTPETGGVRENAVTVPFGELWQGLASESDQPRPQAPEPRTDGQSVDEVAPARPLPAQAVESLSSKEPVGNQRDGMDGEIATFTVSALSPVPLSPTTAPAGQAGGDEAEQSESAEDTVADGEASKAAKAVENVLESGLWEVFRVTERSDVGPDERFPDGGEDDQSWQQAVAEAAADLQDALNVPIEAAPSPSDFVLSGPESGQPSLMALANFFDAGLFETVELSLMRVEDASAPGGGYGIFEDNPPLLVAYDSDVALLDTFSFMPGVVFVDEDLLTPYASVPDEPAFDVVLNNAGNIEILGFYAIDQVLA